VVSVRPLSIAILGTRGVPARYGGFETFAAELGKRLVARGHTVTVYSRGGRYHHPSSEWEGIRRVELPAIPSKYLETVSHAFLSAIHSLAARPDVVLLCNAANAFVLPLLKAARIPTVINVDGIERQRKKWNWMGRAVYQAGESFSARFSDALIADAEVIAEYYRRNYVATPEVIAYGSDFPVERDTDVLQRLGVSPRGYFLYVSRLEPENNPIAVRDAFITLNTNLKLALVGDAPYSSELIARLRDTRDPRVVLPGAIYGADYRTLQRNAYAYIQATEVGGTHPALIEAMGSGGAVLANGTPENREAGGDTVRYFSLESLPGELQWALNHPDELDRMRERARMRARSQYSWAQIADAYEALFQRVVTGESRSPD
jgi:glycosyltransferase involved in cell wall biosynthesis